MRSLLIKNALPISPEGVCQETVDFYIEDGLIKRLGHNIVIMGEYDIIDVEGAFVSSGWVDAHTHINWEPGQPCINAKETYGPDGMTCVVDAGTNGPTNYNRTHDIIAASPILIKSYLNVASNGISIAGKELTDISLLNKEAFTETYARYSNEIIGVKIRIDPRVNADVIGTLVESRKLADMLNLPLIIHPTRCRESLDRILEFLGPNDVFAHTYSALSPCILDENGKLKPCVREARKRGVWFDLSHGSSNFSFEIAQKAIEQDFVIDTISTDLHTANLNGPVRCMADTMTKMLYLGIPLPEIIQKVTVAPVKMLGIQEKVSSIAEGTIADLTFFRVESGTFELSDSYKNSVTSDQRITPVLTVFREQVFTPRRSIMLTHRSC